MKNSEIDFSEISANAQKSVLKSQRNALLQNSDWTQVNDNSLSPQLKFAWRKWREALRLIDFESIDLVAFVFPDAPNAENLVPSLLPLTPVQFDAVLQLLGVTYIAIETAIDATLPNAAAKAVAKAKLRKSERYYRDSPLFGLLGPALNKTPSQIDAAWQAAQDIE